jgi:hypothetical protein
MLLSISMLCWSWSSWCDPHESSCSSWQDRLQHGCSALSGGLVCAQSSCKAGIRSLKDYTPAVFDGLYTTIHVAAAVDTTGQAAPRWCLTSQWSASQSIDLTFKSDRGRLQQLKLLALRSRRLLTRGNTTAVAHPFIVATRHRPACSEEMGSNKYCDRRKDG